MDRVSLTTFALQEKWVGAGIETIKSMIDEQVESIVALKVSFEKEAKIIGREAPIFDFIAIMVPHWKKGEDYTGENYESPDYITKKNEYFNYLRIKCAQFGINVVDFYDSVATSEEKRFLDKLEALGSTADLMKTRSIINSDGHRHLQIDTNTHLSSKSGLYQATFGAETQKDGLNASYYDSSGLYVSAHNKIVYTAAESDLVKAMLREHERYIGESQDRVSRKTPRSNQIYAEEFCKACLDIEVVEKHRKYYLEWNNLWSFYQAKLDAPIYHLTQYIVTAINMSWSQGDGKVDYCKELKALHVLARTPSGGHNDLDYQSIAYLIKKYTDPHLTVEERQKLLFLSNFRLDQEELISFFHYVICQKDSLLLGNLLRTIPKNALGDELKLQLFKSLITIDNSLNELISNPLITEHTTPESIETIARFIPDEDKYLERKTKLFTLSTTLLKSRVAELEGVAGEVMSDVFESIKLKFSMVDKVYQVNESDRALIDVLINDLMEQGCLQELSIEQFRQLAVSSTANRYFTTKLFSHPEVRSVLEQQSFEIQETIKNTIYRLPDKGFNQMTIDQILKQVLNDIEQCKIKLFRDEFGESPEIKIFIDLLNDLAERGDSDEKQVERMVKALTSAVNTLHTRGNYPQHLREAYDKLASDYPDTLNYDQINTSKAPELGMFSMFQKDSPPPNNKAKSEDPFVPKI